MANFGVRGASTSYRINLDGFLFDTTNRLMARAINSGWKGATGRLSKFGAAIQSGVTNKGAITGLHREIADHMRDAVIDAYSGRDSISGGYRAGQGRFPGGALRAISSPAFTRGTFAGIEYFNMGIVNAEAKHLLRLNFGMKGSPDRGGPEPGTFQFVYDGRTLFNVRLPFGRRPANSLPVGFFVGGAGREIPLSEFRGASTGNPFYPKGRRKLGVTAGIASSQFLDAGLDALTREGPRIYKAYIDSIKNRALGSL